jgi:tRNA (mo5U34)-methyltransferase
MTIETQARSQQTYGSLSERWPHNPWVQQICKQAEQTLTNHVHGDLPRWREALAAMPVVKQAVVADRPMPVLGEKAPDQEKLKELLMCLHPWRKGPFELAGVPLNAEWRSDWKWQRIGPHLDLDQKTILDIGCGNGYFGWRMLAEGAKCVIGIDPTLVYVMQWLACRHFAGDKPNYVLPLRVEELAEGTPGFDLVFSMGVLYHRRDPLSHLQQTLNLLKPGGQLLLETLVLPEGGDQAMLVPEQRYARMRNVWAIPNIDQLQGWLREAGFSSSSLLDVTPTSTSEQRSTQWMTFESLQQALDPMDLSRTIEGYPAPTRAVMLVQK